MSLPQVMFVDDEPNLLSGLRRLLRNQRGLWETHFAQSGDEALAIAKGVELDAVVSDMRMPGMNGAELLTEIQRTQPHAARIVLSGHAEREAIITAVGPAQQFLAKPCSGPDVIDLVDRVIGLKTLVPDVELRTLICGVGQLPSAPDLAQELRTVVLAENPSVDAIVALLQRDPSSCAEIFKMTNTAFFGLPRQADGIRSALTMLGTDTLAALVRAQALFQVGAELPGVLDPTDLGALGARASSLVHAIAAGEGWSNQVQAQLGIAGLMHVTGVIILGSQKPQQYALLRANVPLTVSEQSSKGAEHLGTCPYGATAYLLGLWGFAPLTVDAVAQLSNQILETNGQTPEGAALRFAVESLWNEAPASWQPDGSGFLTAERIARWSELVEAAMAQGLVSVEQ